MNKRRIGIVLGVVSWTIIGAIALFVFPIWNYRSWPSIDDPAALVAECEELSDTFRGEVPKEKLPKHLSELHPWRVVVVDDYVDVMVKPGGIGDPWGYRVFSDSATASAYPKTWRDNSRTPLIVKY